MVKRGAKKKVDPHDAERYLRVGRNLLQAAEDLSSLAGAFYGNAIGILCVHTAITYTDALTIRAAGIRSSDEHTKAADRLIETVAVSNQDQKVIRVLRSILARKEEIEYSGDFYTLPEARKMLQDVKKYATWAEEKYRAIVI